MSIVIDDPVLVAHFKKYPVPSAAQILRSFVDLSSPLEEHAVLVEVRSIKRDLQAELVAATHKSIEAMHAHTFKALMETMERRDAVFLERIKESTKDEKLRDEVVGLKSAQHTLFEEVKEAMKDVLRTKASSQAKGSASEQEVAALITRLFPTALVEDTRGYTGRGDFILRRPGKSEIMFENKFCGRNLDLVETTKFIRDALNLKCSAVLMSQKSGIVNKEHFKVEVQDRIVLVYLHNVEYDEGMVRSAVDVIDQLEARLAGVSAEERVAGVAIEKTVLDDINAEYQHNLMHHQKTMLKMKESFKMLEEEVRQLNQQPNLAAFLTLTYPQQNASTKAFVCTVCAASYTNQRSLSGHVKKMHTGV
jgi:hypothetical protein